MEKMYNSNETYYSGDMSECKSFSNSTGLTIKVNCSNNNVLNLTEIIVWTPEVIQRVVMIVCIMVLTLCGNSVILFLLCGTRHRKKNSPINMFIVNLAVGDLAVCFVTMTTEILFVAFGEWVLGNPACKILTYLEIVTLASTTFILTSMSIDRYVSLCQPLRFHHQPSSQRVKRMCFASWMLAFVFAIPQLFIFVQTEGQILESGHIKYECRSQGYTAFWQRKLYFTFLTSYILIIPVIVMSFCYLSVILCVWRQGRPFTNPNGPYCHQRQDSKSIISTAKVKTIKMTIAIIITFIACWTPYFVTGLIRIYSEYTFKIPKAVMVYAETSALLQSALNPILYGCFNIKIKHLIRDRFCQRCFSTSNPKRTYNVGATGIIIYTGKVKYYIRQKTNEGNDSSSSSEGMVLKGKDEKCFKLKVRFISKSSSNTLNRERTERSS